jgi:hypothetical protein
MIFWLEVMASVEGGTGLLWRTRPMNRENRSERFFPETISLRGMRAKPLI